MLLSVCLRAQTGSLPALGSTGRFQCRLYVWLAIRGPVKLTLACFSWVWIALFISQEAKRGSWSGWLWNVLWKQADPSRQVFAKTCFRYTLQAHSCFRNTPSTEFVLNTTKGLLFQLILKLQCASHNQVQFYTTEMEIRIPLHSSLVLNLLHI